MKWLHTALVVLVFGAVLSVAKPAEAIVGGEPATETYSWMASLQDSAGKHGCAGALVAAQWVLTARHCVALVTPEQLPTAQVRIGSNDHTSGGTIAKIAQIYTPPGDLFGEDVALLQLTAPVPNQPVRIATTSGATATPTRLLGWGLTCPNNPLAFLLIFCGPFPAQLQQLDTVLVDDWQCAFGGIVGAKELCVGEWGANMGACYGDSGGPALRAVNGEWELTGVTSRPGALFFYGQCGAAPSLYSDATVWRSWVRTTTGIPTL